MLVIFNSDTRDSEYLYFIKLPLVVILLANIFERHLVSTYKGVPGCLISTSQKTPEGQ